MKSFFAVITVILAFGLATNGQNWKRYSFTKDGFRIEAPSEMLSVSEFDGKHGIGLRSGKIHKSVTCYVATQANPVREFGVVVINRKNYESEEALRGIEGFELFIGGDDAVPTSTADIESNGHRGLEYVYSKEIVDGIFTRGRVFATADKIYIIVFRARTVLDISSTDATKFLDSLKLLPLVNKL